MSKLVARRRYKVIVVTELDGSTTINLPACKLTVNAVSKQRAVMEMQRQLSLLGDTYDRNDALPDSDAIDDQPYMMLDVLATSKTNIAA